MRMLAASYTHDKIEAGCDEAGRGCLAGPVVAAAVILPSDYHHELLDDSKKLNRQTRELLEVEVKKEAICWAVGIVDNRVIDQINILNASYQAMYDAIDQLSITPEYLLIDGNRYIPHNAIPHTCMIKGDGRYFSIAAASILAKTYRDELMRSLHDQFPHYGWYSNKGYPTLKHRDAIREFGPSEHHRFSFQLLPAQLELFGEEQVIVRN